MELSILIPVFNEEDNISPMYFRVVKAMETVRAQWGEGLNYEIIYINDGSSDASLNVIHQLSQEHKEVGYINFSRNFGHQVAVSAGIDHARGNAVVIIDGDLRILRS